MDASTLLQPFRIVPVVVIDDASKAVQLAETLLDSGVAVIEVTLRTPAALEAIESIARAVPDMRVGAGSVRAVEQFSSIRSAGAQFAVSPGSTPALLEAARRHELPFVPGAETASEMLMLLEHGYRLQKFFPAGTAGGVGFLKSVSSPIPEVKFVPTGGIGADRAPDYLALPNVASVGGSWLTPRALVDAGRFADIARIARDAAALGV